MKGLKRGKGSDIKASRYVDLYSKEDAGVLLFTKASPRLLT
jgi:hypothetical protein